MAELIKTTNGAVAPQPTGLKGISQFMGQDAVKAKFAEILGQKANGFIASVLSCIQQSDMLKNADQNSIYMSAMVAASLDLPINNNLGLAYIVPYNQKQKDGSYKVVAQFQLGYKGFKQLAQRSGQFLTIHDTDVREGEITSYNRMTGEIKFDSIQDATERLSRKVIGYVSYFKLLNGFESTLYLTVEEIEAHAMKYSQTYKKYKTGLWKDEKDGMARKTVTKLNLSKNAPLSIEMQRAVVTDQSVIKNYDPSREDTIEVETEYVDNPNESIDPKQMAAEKGRDRLVDFINNTTVLEDLLTVEKQIPDDDLDLIVLFSDKKKLLQPKK